MNTTELLFQQPPLTSGGLLFGDDDTARADVTATIAGSFVPLAVQVFAGEVEFANVTGGFPPLQVAAWLVPSVDMTLAGGFAPLAVRSSVAYDSNTDRPLVGVAHSRWQVASPEVQSSVSSLHQDGAALPAGFESGWQDGTPMPVGVLHNLPKVFQSTPAWANSRYQEGTALSASTRAPHQDATRTSAWAASRYQAGAGLHTSSLVRHQDGTRIKNAISARYQEAVGLVQVIGGRYQEATRAPTWWSSRAQEGVPPPPGISVLKPPEPPKPPCYTPNGELLFAERWVQDLGLLFSCPGKTPVVPGNPIIVPVKRIYYVMNNVNLHRVSDNAVVPALSMSLSLDYGSWTWSFNASLPATAQALVEPTADGLVELRATVNGTEFRVLAENVSRDRTFGKIGLQVSGRGRNAVLDAPFSPAQHFSNSIDRTSQQLLDDVLQFNNVSLGYAIEYGLEPWMVPAGVFAHQGTYISALSTLVKAGGGYLVPHPSALAFKVKHTNPIAPWEVQVPDIVLPSSVVTREAVSWVKKPDYNRVYVSGQEQGVLGRVTRAGTSGDNLASMVTDALITSAAAARQRGLSILADTGRQLSMNLGMPLLPEIGIVEPGAYVQYVDGSVARTGIVRNVNITVGGQVDVKQTLGVQFYV